MHPYLLHTDTAALPAYGVIVALAFTAAFLLVHARAERAGIEPDKLLPVYLAAGVGGLLGARALFLLAVNPGGLLDPSAWLASGGMAYYGGVLGGLAAIVGVALATKIPLLPLFDLAAPALVLALGIGRLGCFMAGCCHGAVVDMGPDPTALLPADGFLHGQIWLSSQFPFFATEFDAGTGGVASITGRPLYPTQLWSSIAGLGVGGALAALWERRRFDGQVAATMLLVEPIFRIAIEAFRADHRGVAVALPQSLTSLFPGLSQAAGRGSDVAGLTTSQAIGLAMMIAGTGLWVWASRRSERSSAV